MGREEHANRYHWRVLTVSRPHWVRPRSRRVCFPSLHRSDSRLLCRELSEAGPGLHALPRPKPLRFGFSATPQRRRLGWACVLRPSQARAAQATRCLARGFAPSWRLRLTPSQSQPLGFLGVQWARLPKCAVCLFWGAGLWLQSSRRMSILQSPQKSWVAEKPACSLAWDDSLRPNAPFRLWLPSPACLWQGAGAVHSQLAVLSPLFCEQAWRGLRLGLFG